MERPGRAGGHSIRIRKTIELTAGSPELVGPLRARGPPARASACTSPSRSTWRPWPATRPTAITPTRPASRLGMLDARLDLPHTSGLTLTDEWLDLSVGLSWSQSARRLVLPDRDRQPERRRLRRGLPVIGRHPPLARHGRRTRPLGGPDPMEPRSCLDVLDGFPTAGPSRCRARLALKIINIAADRLRAFGLADPSRLI